MPLLWVPLVLNLLLILCVEHIQHISVETMLTLSISYSVTTLFLSPIAKLLPAITGETALRLTGSVLTTSTILTPWVIQVIHPTHFAAILGISFSVFVCCYYKTEILSHTHNKQET